MFLKHLFSITFWPGMVSEKAVFRNDSYPGYLDVFVFADPTVLHCNACGDRSGEHIVPPVRYPEDCAYQKPCQHDEVKFVAFSINLFG